MEDQTPQHNLVKALHGMAISMQELVTAAKDWGRAGRPMDGLQIDMVGAPFIPAVELVKLTKEHPVRELNPGDLRARAIVAMRSIVAHYFPDSLEFLDGGVEPVLCPYRDHDGDQRQARGRSGRADRGRAHRRGLTAGAPVRYGARV